MKQRSLLLLIILNFLFGGIFENALHAQTNIDSLKAIWKNESAHDTIRLDAIEKLAREGYFSTQPDSAFYFLQLELCRF